MSEIKTLEEKFLADFRTLELENEKLKARLAEYERPIEEEKVSVSPRLLECPIETIYLSLASQYDYKTVAELTLERIKKACASREGLVEIADLRVNSYSHSKLMRIEYRTFPYTLKIMGNVYGIDFFCVRDNYEMTQDRINFTRLSIDAYITSEKYEELYEYGLKKLKEQLLAYADKLDKEAASEV